MRFSASPRPRRRSRLRPAAIVAHLVIAVLLVFALLPLVVMVATSFKAPAEIFDSPTHLLPRAATWEHYAEVFTGSDMPRALINSALVAFLVAVVTVVLGSSTGYALARIRFRGADTVSVALLLGQLLPVTVLLLPLFQLVVELQLIDQIPGLGLAQLVLVLPLVCWLIASAFRGVPFELEEAAMIDGCSRLGAITRVVLPVAAPGIAAAGVFSFLESWNEFVLASVITQTNDSQTAPIALSAFAGQFDTDWGATMAGSTVIAVPIMVLFLFVQRYFVRGMAAGAVKG